MQNARPSLRLVLIGDGIMENSMETHNPHRTQFGVSPVRPLIREDDWSVVCVAMNLLDDGDEGGEDQPIEIPSPPLSSLHKGCDNLLSG